MMALGLIAPSPHVSLRERRAGRVGVGVPLRTRFPAGKRAPTPTLPALGYSGGEGAV